jgi:hypothetical protein
MTGQELIIVFKHDKAFLTSDKALTFNQLDLPEIAKSFKATAFWTIKVLNFRPFEKKIFAEIQSYQIGEIEFPYNQLQLADKLNEVEKVTFRSIDTSGLLKTLAGTTPIKITPLKLMPEFSNEPIYHQPKQFVREPKMPFIKEPIKQTIKETFYIPLKNVRFKLGGVSFDKKFEAHNKTLEITISNYDIREEFDAVKNYFANVLNSKKIEVTAIVEIIDNKVISIDAKSPEIAKIDKQLIDNVKFEFIKQLSKKKISAEIDKKLFTMDEYFDTFTENEFKSNTFYSSDKELFEDLLTISNTKHYKHLRFLSSKHSHDIMKLRFVHKPFSFIFLIKGEKNYHIIWETLDTEEATYIWHIEKDLSILKMTLRKIEDIINTIKVQGKTSYISETKDPFRRIYHDYSEIVEGFVKWKGEVENVLT